MRQREKRHPFDDERPASRLQLRVALHREPAPPPGAVDPPFRWGDVLEGEPPGEAERGPPVWCVPGIEVVHAGIRVENALLVRSLERGIIDVEDRLCVTQRAFAPVIEMEREGVGAKLEDARAAAITRAQSVSHPVDTAVHHATAAALGGARRMTRGVATLPDKLAHGARRAAVSLATPDARRQFWRGLVDPNDLTAHQKAVTLFIGLSAIAAALVVAHFAVTLIVPDFARPWRSMFLLFLYGFATSIGAPLPIEPVLLPAARALGPFLAIGVTLLAKVLAAWMVFFLGDEVNDKIRASAQKRPWVGRALDRCEAFARRFGLWAVSFFIAIPGLPDVVALYVFASLHMRLWKFLLGVAIGGAILYTSVTFGLLALLPG